MSERVTAQPSLLTLLEPIDPTTQVERIPAIDARCEQGLTETTCRWPWCLCFAKENHEQSD